jgi:hypothetical protein
MSIGCKTEVALGGKKTPVLYWINPGYEGALDSYLPGVKFSYFFRLNSLFHLRIVEKYQKSSMPFYWLHIQREASLRF